MVVFERVFCEQINFLMGSDMVRRIFFFRDYVFSIVYNELAYENMINLE